MSEEYTPPEGKVIDHDKIGKKGYPRHWQALGLEPPLKDAPEPVEDTADQPA